MVDILPPVVAAEEAAGSPPPTGTIEEKAYRFVRARAEAKTHKGHVWYKDWAKDHTALWSDAKVRKNVELFAQQWGCTKEAFLDAFDKAVKRVAKERKENLSKLRAPKQDFLDGLKLHKIETLQKLHEVLNLQWIKKPAAEPVRPTPTLSSLLQLTEELTKRDVTRALEFESKVKAAAEAMVPGLIEEKEKVLREWKETQGTFAEWNEKLNTREARLNERNISLTAKEKDPTGVKKLQQDNDKLTSENYELGRVIGTYEATARQAKKRKQGRAAEKHRSSMFEQHDPCHTPQSASKRTATQRGGASTSRTRK